MVCIEHTDRAGAVDAWIIGRDYKDAAQRAEDGGYPPLAQVIRSLRGKRGVTRFNDPWGIWTHIAGGVGR